MSVNGSGPPADEQRPPLRARLTRGNLPCAGLGCTGLILFLIILFVATSHPLEVIVAGVVIMAIFGAGMLIWRE